jgi:hypothetical protein
MTSIREKKVGKEKEKRKHEDGDLRHAQGGGGGFVGMTRRSSNRAAMINKKKIKIDGGVTMQA